MTIPSLQELLKKESFTLEEFISALTGGTISGSFGPGYTGPGFFSPAPPTPPKTRTPVTASVEAVSTSGSAAPLAAVSQSRSLLLGLLFN